MKLHAGLGDIVPFIKGIVSSFEAAAGQKRLSLAFHCEEESVSLYFDPPKVEDILCNLLINALKFTPPGGDITVTLRRTKEDGPGWIEIAVRDTGPGIPKEQLEHIFERFYQAGGEQSQAGAYEFEIRGTGIGLALAKELVNLHHGSIDVHSSPGEKGGTEFIIRLPSGGKHLSAEEKGVPGEAFTPCSGAAETLAFYAANGQEEEAEDVNDGADREKNMILVVEDNPDARQFIRSAVEPAYAVREAADGRRGIKKAKEIIPDLIISDVMMPGIDGFELCKRLKTDIKTSHIPIILLTAKAGEEDIVAGLETGADAYITKPFNTDILNAHIKNLIELRRSWQQRVQREMTLQPTEPQVSSMDREFISEVQQVIEKNLSEEHFGVDQLGRKLYMSRATLYRKIMALAGEAPREFIKSYRLKRGAQLLKARFGNVTEVALEVGFSSTAYFSKCFKEKFHQLPSDYTEPGGSSTI